MGHRRKILKQGHETCTLIPPDGGYGWIVLIGGIINSICAPSIVGCFGIILPIIREDTHSSVARTAWISSLAQALNFFSSPLTAMLAFTYSFRKVAISGGVLISVGMCLTQFIHQVELMYLTVGVMGGLGFGFAAKSSLFVINQYFDKHRGLVTGAQYSGAAVSRLIFPLIVQGLLDEYGYRGTLLIWGALLTHICAASALFQPPIWHKIHIPGPMCSDHFLPNPTDANKNAVEDNNSKDTVKIADVLSNERLCADEPSYKIDEMKLIQVLDGIKTTNTTSEATSNKCKQFNVPMNSKDSEHLMADTDKVYNDCGPLSSSTIARIESSLNIDYVIDDSECEKSEDDERRKKTKMHRRKCKTCFGGHCGRGMIKQLDYSLFKDFRFYIVASSGICTSFAITNSFVFLPPLGQDKGFSPSQTAWLLSSVGIGEIFGRLITPWLRDLGIIRAKHAYMLGAIMSSIIAFALTLPETYIVMVTLCICLGISSGSIFGLNAVINAETVGVQRLASSLAFTQFSQGIFTLPSGPILGAIRDSTQSYNKCFYIISFFYFASFLIWFMEIIKSMKNARKINNGDSIS